MAERITDSALSRKAKPAQEEDQRVREAYARRRLIPAARYARTDPFNLYSSHEREAVMASFFRSRGLNSLAGIRILDVGCGRGDTLRLFMEYGAQPELLTGIDLLEDRVQKARQLTPNATVVCGSATQMPFPDSSFDLVVQFTLFTSILHDEVKRSIAAEMARVLSPSGRILWYDFTYNNPSNADVRGIGKREIRALFPGFNLDGRRLTLAPPLGRRIAPVSIALYYFLSRFRPLCTHYLGLLQRSADAVPAPGL